MAACTFFGHRDTPKEIEPILQSTLKDLIENKNVNFFYVGNQGSFDSMVRKNLKLLQENHPHIKYAVVLAYLPGKKDVYDYQDYSDTIFPDGLESTPPRFAIAKRNEWMANKSDYAVVYVKISAGGAAKYKNLAERKKKAVINLADLEAEQR